MSDFADPSKANIWLDGDAFRAPAGTAIPADIFADSLTGWDAFGGIQAGFVIERPQQNTRLPIWNKKGPYKIRKGQEEPVIRMRAVDMSKATALTLLTGGSIVAANGGYKWLEGDEEEFAYICRVEDGGDMKAYYVEIGTLNNRPSETLNDEQIAGWDIEIAPLVPEVAEKPIVLITLNNALA